MAYRCEIECPCCGATHFVDVPDRFACVRSAHVSHRDSCLNHVGLFRRLSREIQMRCPTTKRFYQLLCTRTYARN